MISLKLKIAQYIVNCFAKPLTCNLVGHESATGRQTYPTITSKQMQILIKTHFTQNSGEKNNILLQKQKRNNQQQQKKTLIRNAGSKLYHAIFAIPF